MTTSIKVNPKLVNPKGDLDSFGEETGTPEFYIVTDILYKHWVRKIYRYLGIIRSLSIK